MLSDSLAIERSAVPRYNPGPLKLDLAAMEAQFPFGLPPAMPGLAVLSPIAGTAELDSIFFHHARQRRQPRSQAEALEAGANLLPSLFDVCRGSAWIAAEAADCVTLRAAAACVMWSLSATATKNAKLLLCYCRFIC
jgi:hypothetical protein